MSTDPSQPDSEWDAQALRDIAASHHIEALVLTSRAGRVLHSELRREVPQPLGPLIELSLECAANMGRRLGLGEMAIAASLNVHGAIVCGRTDEHSVVIITSHKGSLGQLINQVRRVFPGRTLL